MTTENFEDLSDFEITDRLARILLRGQSITFKPAVDDELDKLLGIKQTHIDIITPSGRDQRLDFCRSWDNTGPLIYGHHITLLNISENDYEVSYDFYGNEKINGTDELLTHTIDTNKYGILRAVAICCIMKLEAKHGKA